MLLCNTDEDLEKEAAYLRLLRMRRVDGLVVAPSTSAANGPWTARLDIPIVFVDRTVHGVNVDAVLVDNVGGMREAIKYLAGLGHRRIGLITGRPGVYTSEQRFRGYREALGELGLAFDPGLVRTGCFRLEGGQSAAAELLACPAPPTAIFASNNLMAIGAMRALAEAGLRGRHRIPRNLRGRAVCGGWLSSGNRAY